MLGYQGKEEERCSIVLPWPPDGNGRGTQVMESYLVHGFKVSFIAMVIVISLMVRAGYQRTKGDKSRSTYWLAGYVVDESRGCLWRVLAPLVQAAIITIFLLLIEAISGRQIPI